MSLREDDSRSDALTHDQLIARLRQQAGLMTPELPAGMHRRIATALAALEPAPRPFRGSAAARWISVSAAGIVVGVIVAIAVMRNGNTATQPQIAIQTEKPSPHALVTPAPVTLVQQWVDNPLEGELRDLLNDVSRATETMTSVLPAARKAGARAGDAGV